MPQVLSCSTCIDPCIYGRRSDPWGEYIKRYLPELANYPVEYIYEPWKAPLAVQEKAGCIVGKDYPAPIVDHKTASKENVVKMEKLKQKLLMQMAKVNFLLRSIIWVASIKINFRFPRIALLLMRLRQGSS